ncbi:hypothetical protein DFH28DRAFT_929551 [Melampsora americana]|nr:hypothetical protein DFH28DRAFT_929551 [Melampsora americana]
MMSSSQANVYHARNCYLFGLISKQRREDQTSKGNLSGAGWTKVTTQFNKQYPGSFSKALLKDHFDHVTSFRKGLQNADSGDCGEEPVLLSRAEMRQGVKCGHPRDQVCPGPDHSRSPSSQTHCTPTPKQKQSDSGSGSLSRKRSKKTEDDPPYSVKAPRNSEPDIISPYVHQYGKLDFRQRALSMLEQRGEILALSKCFKFPIHVIQVFTSTLKIGEEEFKDFLSSKKLWIR